MVILNLFVLARVSERTNLQLEYEKYEATTYVLSWLVGLAYCINIFAALIMCQAFRQFYFYARKLANYCLSSRKYPPIFTLAAERHVINLFLVQYTLDAKQYSSLYYPENEEVNLYAGMMKAFGSKSESGAVFLPLMPYQIDPRTLQRSKISHNIAICIYDLPILV